MGKESVRYNVLIVGAGNIGASFDRPSDKKILTHAHAYTACPGFKLAGFVDSDVKRSIKASRSWGGKAFASIEEAFSSGKVDVVSVAVPDSGHYEVLRKISRYPIKLVFCEKPLALSVRHCREISELYFRKKILLIVNYTRRFVPEFNALRKDISSGKYGKFVTGTGHYGKGLFHNGSHMVDLLRFLLGEVRTPVSLGKTEDYYDQDPSVSAFLRISGGDFYLAPAPCGNYTVFEIDLFFQKSRIRITESGFRIEKYDVKTSPVFKGYKILGLSSCIETDLGKGLLYAAKNIYDCLKGAAEPLCSGREASLSLASCEKIKKGKNA